ITINSITANNAYYWQGFTTSSFISSLINPTFANLSFVNTNINSNFSLINSNLSSYVPYVGASKNVNIVLFGLTSNTLTTGSNGLIGIGTSTPSHELTIIGTANATHLIGEGNGITNITATVLAGSLTSLAQDFTDTANVGTDETKLYQLNVAANQLVSTGDS